MPWTLKTAILVDIASGLARLHRSTLPVLHRDLKSHNVLIRHDYRACLCDFGLAKVKEETSSSTKASQSYHPC